MERQGDEVHITTEEARGGRTGSHVRAVLLISLVLAIAVLSLTWITGALNADQDRVKDEVTNAASPNTG